jgi:hypothetical protein
MLYIEYDDFTDNEIKKFIKILQTLILIEIFCLLYYQILLIYIFI